MILTVVLVALAAVAFLLLCAFVYLRVRFGKTGVPPKAPVPEPAVFGDEDGQDPDPSSAPTEKLISPPDA